jgi:hypothetical protein
MSDLTTTERPANLATGASPAHGSATGLPAPWIDRLASAWAPIEHTLERIGDWLNPILVKETRQALKSFQFTITFVLVLALCWVATIGGVAWIGPGIFYAAAGGSLLLWYYAILSFPLAVIVPYSTFRSLATEHEDNTYDLLSITSLRPHQIISGKLGSAVAQMTVYFSAIAPCISFTYLLRGVDLPTIALLLAYAFLGSLGLCMIGLLLATLSRQQFGQVFLGVAFVAGLLLAFLASLGIASDIIRNSYAYLGDNEFWGMNFAMATFYFTTFALVYFAAAGMITFTSENRSTPLRIAMLVQQAAFIGWMTFAWIASDFDNVGGLILATFAGCYWYIMGTMLTAERAVMSERVKRRLPQSFLGRVFLTWLNPGPGTGYLFVVANATTIVLVVLLGIAAAEWIGRGAGSAVAAQEIIYLLVIGWGYLVAYLGLGWLIVRALRRVAVVTMLAAALIHFLLLLAGSGIPTTIQLMSVQMRSELWSYLQITNPFWTLYYMVDGGTLADGGVLLIVIPAAAVCVLLLNLGSVVRELNQVRIALPVRVVEDEAQLHPPPEARPTSPWDEPA